MQNQNYEDVVSAIYRHRIAGQETEVKLDVASYRNNGTLAVQLFSRMEDYMGDCPSSEQLPFENPYAVITVNLPESERLAANVQFVDMNNLPDIGRWLVQNNIAKPTKHMAQRAGEGWNLHRRASSGCENSVRSGWNHTRTLVLYGAECGDNGRTY